LSSPVPHLDDERLSDLIEGGGSEADLRHAELCAECRTRLDAWHDAVRAVATPPTISETRRAAAVEAAMAAVPRSDVVPARDNQQVLDLDGHRKRSRRASTVRVAAAAAAVAAIAGVSALVANGGGNASHRTITASPTTYQTGAGQAAGSSSEAPLPLAPPASSTDIGSIDSTAQLVTALEAAGTSRTSSGAAFSGAAASAGAKPTSLGFASCPATSVAGGTLVTEATLVWKGTRAVAFVYANPHGHVALVKANVSCKLLATASY
jgi:hypothetical protein